MCSLRSWQPFESKDEACSVGQRILNGNDTRFEMVSFKKFNRVAKLRPRCYNGYMVLCHANTTRSAGWLLCRYAKHDGCSLSKALYSFETVQGGNSRLEWHSSSQKDGTGTVRFQQQLPDAVHTKVAQSAALAVCLDTCPLSFCRVHLGIRHFVQTIFEMGQSVLANKKYTLNPTYLDELLLLRQCKISVTNTDSNLLMQCRKGLWNMVVQ